MQWAWHEDLHEDNPEEGIESIEFIFYFILFLLTAVYTPDNQKHEYRRAKNKTEWPKKEDVAQLFKN